MQIGGFNTINSNPCPEFPNTTTQLQRKRLILRPLNVPDKTNRNNGDAVLG